MGPDQGAHCTPAVLPLSLQVARRTCSRSWLQHPPQGLRGLPAFCPAVLSLWPGPCHPYSWPKVSCRVRLTHAEPQGAVKASWGAFYQRGDPSQRRPTSCFPIPLYHLEEGRGLSWTNLRQGNSHPNSAQPQTGYKGNSGFIPIYFPLTTMCN